MPGLSIRGYALHRGVSHTAVRKALLSGRITKGDDGSIDPAIADQEWAASTNLSKPRNSVIGRPGAGKRVPSPSPPPIDPVHDEPMPPSAGSGGTSRLASSYADSRAAREAYLYKLARLDFEERSGKLVDADKVREQVYALGHRMRDAMLSLPARLAPVLVGQADQAVILKLLEDEILTSLSELSTAPAIRAVERVEREELRS